MALLYLLPIILMGFVYLYYCPIHSHKFRQSEGQLLYFRSFFYGLLFLTISILGHKLIDLLGYKIIFGSFFNGLADIEITKKSLFYINSLFMMLVIETIVITWFYIVVFGGIFASLLNKATEKQNIDVNGGEKRFGLITTIWKKTKINFKTLLLFESLDDELDRILIDSVIDEKAIILHMDDRKFYIGFVQFYKTQVGSKEELQAIKFIPLRSGYRDKDTLKVTVTTEYDDKDIYQLVLLKENIVSATYYDKNIFNSFIENEKAKNKKLFNKIKNILS